MIFLTRLATCDNKSNCESFTIQLLISLTSVATLVYKAMHLTDFPAVWHEHEQLLVEKSQLDERFRVLKNASAKPNPNSPAPPSSEMAEDTGSESGADDDKMAATAAASFDGGAGVAIAKLATAMPSKCSHLALRSETGSTGARPRTVVGVTTFEIGMLPECGR